MSLAVIPCRMGSTRIPMKNLQRLPDGESLLTWAVRAAMTCDLVVISTDAHWCQPVRDHLADAGLGGVHVLARPEALCGPTADIADATADALAQAEGLAGLRFDLIATLQPAVLLHSQRIVSGLLRAVEAAGAHGGLTGSEIHPFVWYDGEHGEALTVWDRHHYPRSQEMARPWVEINGCQVTTRDTVLRRRRWDLPLVFALCPSWTNALDVDTADDLSGVRLLWPSLRPALEGLHPRYQTVTRWTRSL